METLDNIITYQNDKEDEPTESKNEELNNNQSKEDVNNNQSQEDVKEDNNLNIDNLKELNDIINSNDNNIDINDINTDYNYMNIDINNDSKNNNEKSIDNNLENSNEKVNEKSIENNIENINENNNEISNNNINSKSNSNKISINNSKNNISNNFNENEIDNNNIYDINDQKINDKDNSNNDDNINLDNSNNKENNNNQYDIKNSYSNIKDNMNNNVNNNENIKTGIINSNIINNQNSIISKKDNNSNIDININKEKNQKKIIEKDIIDELIEKIKAHEKIVINRETYKDTLNKLDEELKLGLERINEIKTNKKSYFDIQKELNSEKFSKNKKFKDLLSEINKTIKEINYRHYKNGTYLDYKNIKIIKPKIYFNSTRRRTSSKKLIKNKNNEFYMSSIDGKLIVNGERKDVTDSTNFDDLFKKSSNNFHQIKDRNLDIIDGFLTNRRQNYSIDKMKKNINMNYTPEYRIRRVNRFNRDYFKEELKKINELLFDKSKN